MSSASFKGHTREIFFFPFEKGVYQTNPVKNFLHFLKIREINENIKFSYAQDEASLHERINIKENILIDSPPQTFINLKNKNFDNHIKKIPNHFLVKLLKRVFPLERLPHQLNEEERKMAVLVKCLLSPSKYLFLDSPEKNLSTGNLAIFKQSLIYESYYSNKTILITSSNHEAWLDMATSTVRREDKTHFKVEQNIQYNKNVLEFIDEFQQNQPLLWQVVSSDKKVS